MYCIHLRPPPGPRTRTQASTSRRRGVMDFSSSNFQLIFVSPRAARTSKQRSSSRLRPAGESRRVFIAPRRVFFKSLRSLSSHSSYRLGANASALRRDPGPCPPPTNHPAAPAGPAGPWSTGMAGGPSPWRNSMPATIIAPQSPRHSRCTAACIQSTVEILCLDGDGSFWANRGRKLLKPSGNKTTSWGDRLGRPH